MWKILQQKHVIGSKIENVFFRDTRFAPHNGYPGDITGRELHMSVNSKWKGDTKKSALFQVVKIIRRIKWKFVKTALNYLVYAFKRQITDHLSAYWDLL